ncbi:hypothetical protein GNF10_13890 [Nostoc sp. UCD121]|uniref:hypothetical protein n=1 Tax=unclassified Nostoc TaxID=2593658 RepID=UPI0016284F8C|nr:MULTISPECIES: hypothetical protein [unclassified Nostoc]MBC1222478.1 hypothetical protein [Nostoc sp. UCD120]MBC1277033.1 hypothetical protein [Nostoc sp. UCD121]MBC1297190.1 hypothetical protein [Nostoc sp. UCD122]
MALNSVAVVGEAESRLFDGFGREIVVDSGVRKLLDTIPGVARQTAELIVGEIGTEPLIVSFFAVNSFETLE